MYACAQQGLQFSQYVFNGLSINPAYAGYQGVANFNTMYRQQWVNFPGAPVSCFVSIDGLTGVKEEKMALGAQIIYEKLGPQQSIALKGAYVYRIPLNTDGSKRLCLGINATLTQYSLDGTALVYADPNDPVLPASKVNTLVPDADFGALYYTSRFYAGVSFMELFSLNQQRAFYYTPGYSYASIRKSPHIYLTSGILIPVSQQVKLRPSFLVKSDFNGPTSIDLNLFALLAERLWVGGAYRWGIWSSSKSGYEPGLDKTTAASLMVNLYATEHLRFGYAYDFTTSGLADYQNGTHEISIGILLGKQLKDKQAAQKYF